MSGLTWGHGDHWECGRTLLGTAIQGGTLSPLFPTPQGGVSGGGLTQGCVDQGTAGCTPPGECRHLPQLPRVRGVLAGPLPTALRPDLHFAGLVGVGEAQAAVPPTTGCPQLPSGLDCQAAPPRQPVRGLPAGASPLPLPGPSPGLGFVESCLFIKLCFFYKDLLSAPWESASGPVPAPPSVTHAPPSAGGATPVPVTRTPPSAVEDCGEVRKACRPTPLTGLLPALNAGRPTLQFSWVPWGPGQGPWELMLGWAT